MKRFFPSLAHSLHHSVLVRMAIVMSVLALLSLASIVISTLIADDISGRASAVNVSGSLRMLSFRTLSEVQQVDKRQQALATMQQFEQRLLSLERFTTSKSASDAASVLAVRGVLQRWQIQIMPLEQAAASGDPSALLQVANDIPDFVDQIDHVVQLIEEELENKAKLLRVLQLALLACIIVISVFTLWMLRWQLVQPLAQLLEAAKTVSQGSFTVRVVHVSDDEMGQLGRAFNTMVSEIAHMYAHLEEKVDDKTRELTRINESLELLYRTSQQLSASDLTLDTIQLVMRDIEQELDLGHSMICISESATSTAQPLLGNLSQAELSSLCGGQDCAGCFARSHQADVEQRKIQVASGESVVFVPLEDSEQLRGTMPIFLKNTESLPHEKSRVIETVGRHVSNALSNMRRAEEKHRLAVLEERSVIARELHDSIAQSLSYLKIQVTRLEKSLGQPEVAQVIAQELKSGLNAAYKELRELITTFRLRIDERGFNAALKETVEEYSAKLGFAVELSNELVGIALSGNEEMHVIRIIREALINIEKHAEASAARIRIKIDVMNHQVNVLVADNGKGFDPQLIPPNHYGTSIMRDRAQSLAGDIDIHCPKTGGSEVRLTFQPQKYRVAASIKEI
jgi:two-component system nitrate/nitrite sensor histidine kinase NarX